MIDIGIPSSARINTSILLTCALLFAGLVSGCDDDPKVTPPPLQEGNFAALGEIRPNATAEERETFARGEEVAKRRWTIEQGLGPEFNTGFCTACHLRPASGGSSPRYRDFFIHHYDREGTLVLPPEDDQGNVVHFYGVGESSPRPEVPNYNPDRSVFTRRSAIPFFGVGMIAAIDGPAILANADPDDADGDGISGRPNCPDGFIGRFGRKSQTTSLEGFIRGPIFNHMQITSNPLPENRLAELPIPSSSEGVDVTPFLCNPAEGLPANARNKQVAAPPRPLIDFDDAPDPEMSEDELFDIVSWVMLLAAPEAEELEGDSLAGSELFTALGCEGCHVRSLPSQQFGEVPLFSDLLLHDMGKENYEPIEMVNAGPQEFRTQPLWGVGATGPYLHDGRADTLDQAIRAHGGEGDRSRQAYLALSSTEQEQVLEFLRSLGGREQTSLGLIDPRDPVPGLGEPGGPRRVLNDEEMAQFIRGRNLFDADFEADSGIGDLFNGDSCRACHFDPAVGGSGPIGVNVVRFGNLDDDGVFTEPGHGSMLHKLGAPGSVLFRGFIDDDTNVLELRQTPTTLGLALLEEASDEAIRALADPDDLDGDGISGRASELVDGRLGKFGWKAQIGTVREFIRDALSGELGLTLPLEEGSLTGTAMDADPYEDPEVDVSLIDDLTFFTMELAVPGTAELDEEGQARFDAGYVLFGESQCTSCHVEELPGVNGPVQLYSDLLLHDVQPEDYRGVSQDSALTDEFRTTPLRGVRFTAPYWHDGLSFTLDEAIRRHESEGTKSREAYESLTEQQRGDLLFFLEHL